MTRLVPVTEAQRCPVSFSNTARWFGIVSAWLKDGAQWRLPAETNDYPNFACFVYNEIPEWTGASVPGKTPPITVSAEFMKTMPAYHTATRSFLI